MNEQLGILGITNIAFDHDELVFVGGAYGCIEIQGTTDEARRALDKIIETSRLRAGAANFRLVVSIDDGETPQREDRHAGFERTSRFEPATIAGRAGSEESSDPSRSERRDDDGGE